VSATGNASRQQVVAEFKRCFGEPPTFVVRAPGRVNLIGEHTDYNDGFVLPMAIDRATWIAGRPRSDKRVVVQSLDLKDASEVDLNSLQKGQQTWAEYIKGIAWALEEAGHKLHGWEGVLAGDVPIGAGLSSSAALEVGVARAFAVGSKLLWNPVEVAKLCQRADHQWMGINSGIMDQMISAAGQADHALLIDCRTLALRPVPLPKNVAIVVLDTATRRALVDSAYNDRRAQCEAAAKFFGLKALRDVSLKEFEARAYELDELTRKRARHVISENARTLRAAEVMQRGDARALGRLMNESHTSLRDDFEVSSRELDAMVDCARAVEGCLGARMTGAGFGGCAIALVVGDATDKFVKEVAVSYKGVRLPTRGRRISRVKPVGQAPTLVTAANSATGPAVRYFASYAVSREVSVRLYCCPAEGPGSVRWTSTLTRPPGTSSHIHFLDCELFAPFGEVILAIS
jgi:galactokinase